MENKIYDEGMLTFEDRYENVPSYKHLTDDLESELAWAQTLTTCAYLGCRGLGHHWDCDKFEDYSNSNEPYAF